MKHTEQEIFNGLEHHPDIKALISNGNLYCFLNEFADVFKVDRREMFEYFGRKTAEYLPYEMNPNEARVQAVIDTIWEYKK